MRGLSILEPYGFRSFGAPPCGIPVEARYKKPHARSCRDLREAGCTAVELRVDWGFSALEMAVAGLPAYELRTAGVTTREIAGCRRYTAAQCREAGCTVFDCLGAHFNMNVLKEAGYSAAEFKKAGFTVPALKKLGFTEGQLLEAGLDAGGVAHMLPPPPPQFGPGADAETERPASARPRGGRARPGSARPRTAGARSVAFAPPTE